VTGRPPIAPGSAPLVFHTARINSTAPDRLDITRKTAGHEGIPFAPSWRILNPALAMRAQAQKVRLALPGDDLADRLEATFWALYAEAYRLEMHASYRGVTRAAWTALLARPTATLVCYCTRPEFCHRTVLARILVSLGATYSGEAA